MRFLLFSDLHCDHDAAARLVAMSADADVVIGAGDFGIQHRGVVEMIEALSPITCPAVIVPGNGETPKELESACKAWPSAHVLHGSGVQIDGVDFWGLGGGVPVTPFGDWSYDLTETEARDLLSGCPDNAVLVTHSPPRDACDLDGTDTPLGSLAIRETIVRHRPHLVVCGHIHASWGRRANIGDSLVINAGPSGTLIEVLELGTGNPASGIGD